MTLIAKLSGKLCTYALKVNYYIFFTSSGSLHYLYPVTDAEIGGMGTRVGVCVWGGWSPRMRVWVNAPSRDAGSEPPLQGLEGEVQITRRS